MIIMGDESDLKIDSLISRLLVDRSGRDENDLCRIVRPLSGEKKLYIIEKISRSNVRLAASVASRIHLPVEQQLTLLSRLISGGESNAIKQFAVRLFVFRLSAKAILGVLRNLKNEYPDGVRLMAYYYAGSVKAISSKDKEFLKSLI